MKSDKSPNKAYERPSTRANTPNPSLKGLSHIGVVYEEQLHNELKQGKIKQEDVGPQRAYRLWQHKKQAEKSRNENHNRILDIKQEARKVSKKPQTYKNDAITRKEWEKQNRSSLNASRRDRTNHQLDLQDIRTDAKLHRQEGNFSEKDFHFTTRMEYPHESRELGYSSDGRSKGSSFGLERSQSNSSHSSGSNRSSSRSPEHSSRYRSPSPRRSRE